MDSEYSAAFARITGGEPVEDEPETAEPAESATEAAEDAPETTKEPVVASPRRASCPMASRALGATYRLAQERRLFRASEKWATVSPTKAGTYRR